MTGTNTYTLFNGESTDPDTMAYVATGSSFGLRPAGTVAESYSRHSHRLMPITLTTANAVYQVVPVVRGQVITYIDFWSDSTAAGTPTHQLAGLYDSNKARLVQSADLTTTAWAANTKQRFTLTAPYTVTADGYLYVALAVVATTPPTIVGASNNAVLSAVEPAVSFVDTSNTISTTLPTTATKSAGFSQLYVALS